MSHHKAWNQMSSSSEDQDNEPVEQKTSQQSAQKDESKTKTIQKSAVEHVKHSEASEKKTQAQSNTAPRKTYLTDAQLLQQYANSRVDDPRRIKVVNCYHENNKEIIRGVKTIDLREVKEGMFILKFDKEEECQQFIRDKIDNKWRFHLQPYHVKKREDDGRRGQRQHRNQRRGEREREKLKVEQRQRRAQKPRRERRYQREDSPPTQRQEKGGRRQRKDDRPRKEDEHAKKSYKQRQNFEINSMKSHLIIKKDYFEIPKVLQELQSNGIFKQFAKVHVFSPVQWLPKVSALCLEMARKKNYFVQEPKQIPAEGEVQLKVIERKGSLAATQAFYERYNPGGKKAQNEPTSATKKKEEVVVVSRKLGVDFDKYFEDAGKFNLSELVQGFDEDQFVRRLKDQSAVIFEKHWKVWKLQALQDRIEQLLKLVHRLTKSTIYDVELKPGVRNGNALLTAQIEPRPEKDRRPKVDFSGINGYLSI